MRPTLFLFFFCGCLGLTAQTVSTLRPIAANGVEAVSWHTDGRIYSPDFTRGYLYQIQLDGTLDTLLSNLRGPLGGAFDSLGNFYLSEFGTGKIILLTEAGDVSTIGEGFGGPTGIYVDEAEQRLLVSDYNGGAVRTLSLVDGSTGVLVRGGGLNGPDGIVAAPNGDFIVANFEDNKLLRVTRAGEISTFATIALAPNTGYLIPFQDGYLSTGVRDHRLWYTSQEGEVSVWAGSRQGSTDGDLADAEFSIPNGIAISPGKDSIIITENGGNGRVRLISDLDPATGLGFGAAAPEIELRIFPSPAAERLHIGYELPASGRVDIKILDPGGRTVGSRVALRQPSGAQLLEWVIPSELSAGVYWCAVETSGGVSSKSFVISR